MKKLVWIPILFALGCSQPPKTNPPNILFVMMDDLGYGQFGMHNDTLSTHGLDPFFVYLVDSLEGYSPSQSIEFSKRAVPNISKLANNGILFSRAHTSSNVCSPSRMGIATGILQNRFGIYDNYDGEAHGFIPGDHLAQILKDQDYATAHIGKWHIGVRDEEIIRKILLKNGITDTIPYTELKDLYPDIFEEVENAGYYGSVIDKHHPLNNGFDYYYGYNNWASEFYNSTYVWKNFEHAGKQEGYNTDVFTNEALQFMEKEIKGNRPFYVQLHYHAVHDSLEPKAPPKYFDKFRSESYILNNFYAHIYGVDQNMGKIVDFLKSTQQLDNTLIIFTSDNGAMAMGPYDGFKTGSPLPGNAPFSGHKGNYYQGGVRVPLFMHWPKGIHQRGISDQLVSTMDILPTAIDIAGGAVPDHIDGKSLSPLFQNLAVPEIHDHLIWAGIHSSAYGFLVQKSTKNHDTERAYSPGAWMVVQGDYLLRFTGSLDPGIYNDFMEGRDPIYELYHIKSDPAELHNLAGEQPEKVKELSTYFFDNSDRFPPPVHWDSKRYEELVRSREYLEAL